MLGAFILMFDLEYDFYWLENMIGHVTSHSNLICSYASNNSAVMLCKSYYDI